MSRRTRAALLVGILAAAGSAAWWGMRDGPVEPEPGPPRPAPVLIHVAVRHPDGSPAAGVRVVTLPFRPKDYGSWPGTEPETPMAGWRALPPCWDLTPRNTATTGPDGTASLPPHLPVAAWDLAIEGPGIVRRSASFGKDVAFVAEKGHPLTGRVLTESGDPIAGALVLANYPGLGPHFEDVAIHVDHAFARSGADGVFRFDALPSTEVILRCGPAGTWSSHAWPVRIPVVHDIDLRVAGAGSIEGTLRGGPDRTPIAGADLIVTTEFWHTAQITAHATTDRDGRYRIPVYPWRFVNGLAIDAPAWWRNVRPESPQRLPLGIPESGTLHLDLVAIPDSPETAAVRGTVRGPDGPVAGASVFLWSEEPDPEEEVGSWSPHTRITDDRGRFWFPEAAPGRLAVVVEGAPGLFQPGSSGLFGTSAPPPDPAAPFWINGNAPRPVTADVVLVRGGRISGRVIDDAGMPVGGAVVYGAGGLRAVSRTDGTFLIEGLGRPRSMNVHASASDGLFEGRSGTIKAGVGLDAEGVEVRLQPVPRRNRPEAVVDGGDEPGSPPRLGVIRGIVDLEGRPLARAHVTVEPRQALEAIACGLDENHGPTIEAVTDAAGIFRTRGFSPGTWSVRVEAPGAMAQERDVVIAADGSEAACFLHLDAAIRVRGRVLLAGTRPTPGAKVEIEPCGDDGNPLPERSITTWTREDGGFAANIEECAAFMVTVSTGYDSPVRFREKRSGPHPTGEDRVEIRVEEGPVIAGRVVGPEGRPVPRVRVSCSPSTVGVRDPGWFREIRTGDDGEFRLVALEDAEFDLILESGLDEAVTVSGVHSGRPVGEMRLPAPTSIEGVLVDEDGKPVGRRNVVATTYGRNRGGNPLWIEAVTDDAGRFRLTGVGRDPLRIELASGPLVKSQCGGFAPSGHPWPLDGGASVTQGVRELVLTLEE